MRAIVVTETGGPEQLALEEVPEPRAGPGEVVVEVAAAGINFIDVYQRSGLYPTELPFVPGQEGAGVVVALGPGVEGLSPGDRVAWTSLLGSYAERRALPADRLVPVPDGIELETAAAVMLQGMTAHYLAVDTYPLSPGERCLIHAGAGGVGLLLTQMAAIRGAEVFTTVGTREKAELSRRAGAAHVVVYTEEDFAPSIEAFAGPRPLDVVYDGVGAATFMAGLDLLRPRGMMVTYGNASGPVPEISPLLLMRKGSLYLTRPTLVDYIASRDQLLARAGQIFEWIAGGRLRVTVGAEYPLAEAAAAHRALEGRATTGKVLLRP